MFSRFTLNDPQNSQVFFRPSPADENSEILLDDFLSVNSFPPAHIPTLRIRPQDSTPAPIITPMIQPVLRRPKLAKTPKIPIWSSLVANKLPDWVDVDGVRSYWWDYIANLNSDSLPKHVSLTWSRTCAVCNIKILQHADNTPKACFICGPDGAHFVEPLPDPPEAWSPILTDNRLSGLSRKLNNIFCLTALGVHDGDFMKFPSGIASVTLNGGRTYHRIIPSTEGQHAMRWFIHDPAAFQQSASSLKIPSGWSDIILSGLRLINPFVDALENMHNENSDHTLYLDRPDEITGGDVAAIVAFAPAARPTRRQLVIKSNDGEHIFLDILSPFTEPLHYPLLFPYGTLGWDPDRKNTAGNKFSQMRWYRSRIFLNANKLFRFGRLMGEYIVDAFSRMEEQRLEYLRHNQHSNEDDEDGEFETQPSSGDAEPVPDVRLPSSFIHSPAWSASQISDCLALHKYGGAVTFFITFTCNSDWPEIKSECLPGQNSSDRPDVVIRVYQQRFTMFLKVIQALFGSVVYLIRVREFQKRGPPHDHVGLKVKNPPRTIEEIDKVLCAELPRTSGILRENVKKFMTHQHNSQSTYHRCGWSSYGGKCQYGFPKPITPVSYFDERGYFHPRRRQEEDRWIVLHVPFLIQMFRTHINVELSSGVTLFNYLFKYFYKPPAETNWTVGKKKAVDEIKDYQRGRYVSATEALTRICGFTISAKFPAVRKLPIHLPNKQWSQMRKDSAEGSATLLMRYLDRPRHPRIDNMSYVEFGTQCRLATHAHKPVKENEIVENLISGRPRMRIVLHKEGFISVGRIQMVYPRHGDVFYLRALLLHGRAFHSFADVRTVDGVVHETFQAAARAKGLFKDEDEGAMAFRELVETGASPGQLRWLFCLLAVEGAMVLPLWEKYEDNLSADVLDTLLRDTPQPGAELVRNRTLILMSGVLQGLGKTLTDVGLPEPVNSQPEVDAERLRWGGDCHLNHRLCGFVDSLNIEQRMVYDHVMDAMKKEFPAPIYIDGRAGRGKTFCLYPIIGALRLADEIVLLSASSAFAAKLYPGGRTAHYLYGIPVDEHSPYLESSLRSGRSGRAQLLLAAKCHVIDEIGGLHFKAFDCADRLMRALTGESGRVWGGRLLIILGDFRQVAPVVRYGGKSAIVQASLRTQAVFQNFEILRLTQCMRQADDPQFASWLDSIGDDYENDTVDLGRLRHTDSVTDATTFAFPNSILNNPEECIKHAILSPYNEYVDTFNASILARLTGEKRTYYSSDEVEGNTEGIPGEREIDTVATPEFLNALREPGVPPHELTLAVGSICRLTRNFDVGRGLTKNTRVIVQRLLRHSVEVETLPQEIGGQRIKAERVHIPRIVTWWQPSNVGFKVLRKQLPMVLSYATTFNGCQGLTVLRLMLDLRRPVFSHGQLYSAMTRVPNQVDVLVLRNPGQPIPTVTTNIVWQELLI